MYKNLFGDVGGYDSRQICMGTSLVNTTPPYLTGGA